MKKEAIVLFVIMVLSSFIGIYPFRWYLTFPTDYEWFQLFGIEFIIISFNLVFVVFLVILGFIIRKSNKELSSVILKGMRLSIVLFFFSNVIGVYLIQNNASQPTLPNQEELGITNANRQIEYFDKLLETDSLNYSIYYSRALFKRESGDYQGSLIDFKIALKLCPNDYYINYELGNAHGLIGEKVQQDSFYKVAARLDSNSRIR